MSKANAWIALFLLLVLAAWSHYLPGEYNDDAAYIGLARSLSLGRPYLQEWSPGLSAQTRFPPGFPLLLTPAQWLAPHNYDLCRAIVCLCAAGAMYLLIGYSRWLGIPVLVGSNYLWLHSSSAVLSEQPFLLALLLYFRAVERRQTLRSSVFLGLGLGLLCALRTIGMMLIPATLLFHLGKKTLHRTGFLLGAVLSAGPLIIPGILTGYGGELNKSPNLLSNLLDNLGVLPASLGWMLLINVYDLPSVIPRWLGLLPLSLALLGLWRLRQSSFSFAWVTCCLSLLLVWPYQMPRLLLPLVPFLHIGLWHQLGRRNWLCGALIFLNLGFSCWHIWRLPSHYDDPEVLRAVRALPAGSSIAASQTSLWLATDVPSLHLDPWVGLEWTWLSSLAEHNVRLIILNRQDTRTAESFNRRSHLYHQAFSSSEWIVYRFQPPPDWQQALKWQKLARTALSLQNPDKAVLFFQSALQLAPYDHSIASGLASALVASGQKENARRLLQQIFRSDPDCFEARLASRFL
ncbi:MAG: tetratricopeptide repeat protein [Candidatus Eremiobacteraeota bacterium]|nr:tetratricopeptide repeat protein [Candidatus Eremiobacteraeota bacterium]